MNANPRIDAALSPIHAASIRAVSSATIGFKEKHVNTRYLLRWLLVLVILLAVVATAGAQGEVSAVRYETGSPTPTTAEVEPNAAFDAATPLVLGDVASGKIAYPGDRDTYVFDPPDAITFLVDIDAESIGSPLDPRVCLYDGSYRPPVEVFCNDNANGLDSLISFHTWSRVYIRVWGAAQPDEGGAAYTYKLSIYRPLLVSAATDGTVAGIPFQKSDVLAHYDFADGAERWMLYFDASDVGITQNLVAWEAGYFVLQAAQTLPVYEPTTGDYVPQTVTPYDYMLFTPGYGPETAGQFYFQYHGAELGLTGPGEKIDALAGNIEISTVGAATFSVSGTKVADEDLADIWSGRLTFDGSTVPGLGTEDVVGADGWAWNFDRIAYDRYLLTILGRGRVDGLRVTQKDIFNVDVTTGRVTGIYWHGPTHHFNYNIDAFDAVDDYSH